MRRTSEPKLYLINVRVKESIYKKILEESKKQDKNMSWIVRDIIDTFYNNDNKKSENEK